jgi:pentatricopeptide repeat protein
VSVLVAVGGLSYLKKGKEIHGYVIMKNFESFVEVSSTLVDMYSNYGSLHNCTKVFGPKKSRDVVLYTAMIKTLGMRGRGTCALKLFAKMLERNIAPDHIAFLALLHACSHSGLVDEGKCYFDVMVREYNLTPWPEHYASIVDLLGRTGKIMEAYDFIQSMTVEATAAIWHALLGACQNG